MDIGDGMVLQVYISDFPLALSYGGVKGTFVPYRGGGVKNLKLENTKFCKKHLQPNYRVRGGFYGGQKISPVLRIYGGIFYQGGLRSTGSPPPAKEKPAYGWEQWRIQGRCCF